MIADGKELIDLISEIRSQYNCFDNADQKYYEALSLVLRILRHMPSEQPCDDAVSRAAAIAAVSNWLYDRDDGRSVDQLLSALPSAQPDYKEVLGWLLAYHTISFDLHGRYLPHEVISWLINDFTKEFIAGRGQNE